MTCCGFGTNIFPRKGRLSSYDIEARQRSKEIDSELKIERKKRQHQVRLLLLGAGESGILAKTCPNIQYAYTQYLIIDSSICYDYETNSIFSQGNLPL